MIDPRQPLWPQAACAAIANPAIACCRAADENVRIESTDHGEGSFFSAISPYEAPHGKVCSTIGASQAPRRLISPAFWSRKHPQNSLETASLGPNCQDFARF